ncbi:hypothetical protein [Butyrivibrio sp. WCE2006]|uniref:hypothetical protein n=1 Tax=Butyrivibrio sp. WCE2006 TaxID=1410611 RepID=UPI0005D298FC|nr:hypothetical protein [Butyrivibrio sp. WCE2006]
MASENIVLESTSKYVKTPRERVVFYRCAILYFFILYVMPQYFGIPNPVFDLTIVRISIIILLLFIIFDYGRLHSFIDIILKEKMSVVLIPYLIVLTYTMVLRKDFNALLNPLIEILEMYLLIYIIRDSLGVDKTIKLLIGFIYLLVILGFVESFTKVSPFSYLVTINGIYTGRYIRGGHYRIMSSCVHSLGYGLLLMTAMPFAGYDVEKKEYNVFRRPFLLIGIIVNIFNTGSRSSLGVMFVCLALMFILSDRRYFRINMLIATVTMVMLIAITFATQTTSFGRYILLQLTSLVDSVFETQYSIKYGSNYTQLMQSKGYRDLLNRIFTLDWLNPILGIGRKRAFNSLVDGKVVASIDNFYIAEYIRYAYPGMCSYIFYLSYMVIRMVKDIYKTRSAIVRAVFIGTVTYCYHLTIADSLQTLKYLYVLFAIFICCEKRNFKSEPQGKYHKLRNAILW